MPPWLTTVNEVFHGVLKIADRTLADSEWQGNPAAPVKAR